MRRVSIQLMVIWLSLLPVAGQTHRWPPIPAGRAPVSDTLKLIGGRWLPSTKRWNLVWADQIVPDWISLRILRISSLVWLVTMRGPRV